MRRYVGILCIALLSVGASGCGYGDEVQGVCEDGTYRCNSGNVERCSDGAWVLLYACVAGTICQNGYCPPSPDEVVPIDPCSPDADVYEEWSWEDISGSNDVQTGAYTVWWYDDPCASTPDPVEATLHFAGDVDWYRWNIQASQAGCDVRPTFAVSPSAPDYRLAFYARCYWGDPIWAMGADPADQACSLIGEGVVRCTGTGGIDLSDLRCAGQDVGDGISHTSMEAYLELKRSGPPAAGTCPGTTYSLSFEF